MDTCCHHCHEPSPDQNAVCRHALWAVLAINAAMFAVEIGAGLAAGSASLQADALDFLGDAANYSISLFVVGMSLRYRATAPMLKGASMGIFGLWVIGTVIWHALHGTLPGLEGVPRAESTATDSSIFFIRRVARVRRARFCARRK